MVTVYFGQQRVVSVVVPSSIPVSRGLFLLLQTVVAPVQVLSTTWGHLPGGTWHQVGVGPHYLVTLLSPPEGLCRQSGACTISSGARAGSKLAASASACRRSACDLPPAASVPVSGFLLANGVCSPCFQLSWGVYSFGCVWALYTKCRCGMLTHVCYLLWCVDLLRSQHFTTSPVTPFGLLALLEIGSPA